MAVTNRHIAQVKGFAGGGIYDSTDEFGLNTNAIVLFAFCLAAAFILSYGYVWLVRLFTRKAIIITGILHVIAGFATAIYMLSRKYWSGGIVFLLFAIFSLVCFVRFADPPTITIDQRHADPPKLVEAHTIQRRYAADEVCCSNARKSQI